MSNYCRNLHNFTKYLIRQATRSVTFQVATSASLPTFFEECRYEYRHGRGNAPPTVPPGRYKVENLIRAGLGVVSATVLLAAVAALAQRFGGGFGGGIRHGDEGPRPEFPTGAEFHFIRTEYTDLPQFHRRFGFASRGATGEGWWIVDWPDADEHFSMGVQRLARIHTGDPRHLRLTDPQLFDYPWIYP